ncbi:MAG: Fe-S cluster assembly protein HesB [Acidimicrobiales bacterium]|nr:Fe-S cluster assembly protein HesB [Acidimicrobiaceae bacterium]MDE0321157.1 Fe-S cluster assembly protein HesB [Acidimicrobiaceae bacterium]MXY01811.1 Fe-S cluster assembly protein HesB [Acidimicrobiales bacterium]MYG88334.1 Fe-S cluster assembly protein HesB [Acidimicrobiales bacterium]MYI27857.1 Fe-S cluster assembly protein HesB [Acidimicrobiales bacterium]
MASSAGDSGGTLAVTGDPVADQLVLDDPFALLLGMMLDQQIPMEKAFKGPALLAERLGDRFSPASIAEMDPDELEAAFKTKPAVHRFPGSMAKRCGDLARHLVEHYDGDAGAIWADVRSGKALYDRLRALPGYGDEKAKIFVAILAKRFGVAPRGWKAAAGPFADRQPRSVADIDGPDALAEVRIWKKKQKAAGKSKQD